MSKMNTSFEKSALIVFLISSLGSLFNLIFQFVALKLLPVSEYGLLNVLLSITAVVGTMATLASLDSVRFSSDIWNDETGKITNKYDLILDYIKGVCPVFFFAVVILGIVTVFLNNRLSEFYKVRNGLLISLAVFTGSLGVFSSALSGILQGMQKYIASSMTNSLVFFVKLVLSVILFLLGLSVYGAYISIILGYISSFFISLLIIKNLCRGRRLGTAHVFSVKKYLESVKALLPVQLAITLLSNIDIQAVKIFFDQETTGIYSSAMVIGKAGNYVISALIFVFFPIASADYANNRDTQKVFRKTLIYTILVTGLFAAVCTPLYRWFAIPLLGESYAASEMFIFPIALLFIPISLITVISMYSIARRNTRQVTLAMFAGMFIFLIVSYFRHDSVRQLIFAEAGVLTLVFIWMLIQTYIIKLKSERKINLYE